MSHHKQAVNIGTEPDLPTTHAMQAKHLSGASIGKLVQYSDSRSLVTNDAVYHSGHEHTIYDTDGNEIELPPDSWVRVTQVPA